ncbi:nitronate monooxygenase [bacterium]|nr:nitronate monooxygenase [bacterium]
MKTLLTALLGIEHPIIQAGMGGGANAEIAAAVSNAGALGSLSSIAMPPEMVRAHIAETRALTEKPFAVNMVTWAFTSNWQEIIDTVIEERPPVVTISFGDPIPAFQRCKAAGLTTILQVQDTAGLKAAIEAGADAIIVQGNEAGGHTGRRSTLSFATQALELAGDIPIVVAGGIANGRGLAAALAMGAAGVVMGTRFKATNEFVGQQVHKQAIVASDGGDTLYDEINDIARGSLWPNRVTGRAIRNAFTAEWEGRAAELGAAVAQQTPRGFATARMADPDHQPNWGGEISGIITEVIPAAEVVQRTVSEAEALLRKLSAIQ